MMLDYFYGQSGELFSYFRIPKALFPRPPVSGRSPPMPGHCTASCWTA